RPRASARARTARRTPTARASPTPAARSSARSSRSRRAHRRRPRPTAATARPTTRRSRRPATRRRGASATPANRFLETFVLPLVGGGRLYVRGLIGPGQLARFATDPQLDGTLVAEVTKHLRAHLARVGPVGSVDLLPNDALALAA